MNIYEILYLTYFYIDDYDTACNFWKLNKKFTNEYMNIYNKNYEFKFKLLSKNLDYILKYTAPDANNDPVFDEDNVIYKNLNDIKFCYKLYKKCLINQFIKCDFDYNRQCSWCSLLIYYIFYEGIDILNKIYKIKCVKNKVILIPLFDKKYDLMEIISYLKNSNGYYINKYKINIENVLN